MSGITQREAYDRSLGQVFPGLNRFAGEVFGVLQGEFEYAGQGGQMLLSFKSVPLAGKDGETVGAIVDLHDLTQMKRLAGELKRADRLAAEHAALKWALRVIDAAPDLADSLAHEEN